MTLTISISTSQTFRSWVAIFHLRPPMAFLYHSVYGIHVHRLAMLNGILQPDHIKGHPQRIRLYTKWSPCCRTTCRYLEWKGVQDTREYKMDEGDYGLSVLVWLLFCWQLDKTLNHFPCTIKDWSHLLWANDERLSKVVHNSGFIFHIQPLNSSLHFVFVYSFTC